MDLDRAVDELYGVALEDFLPRRTALAAAAKAAGDKQLVTAIGALRKPTVSAWAVNRLARERPDDAQRLAELADDLRSAQQALDGPRLAALAPVRSRLIDELVGTTASVAAAAGVRVSATVAREVGATFVAALASAGATEAVRSGRLTRALEYAGFGEVDLQDATARPLRAVPDLPGARVRPGRGDAGHRGRDVLGQAEGQAQRAAQPPLVQVVADAPSAQPATADSPDLDAARDVLAGAQARLAALRERRGMLEATLELAETRVATLTHDLARARTHRDEAQAQLADADAQVLAAEGAARRARAALAALTPD